MSHAFPDFRSLDTERKATKESRFYAETPDHLLDNALGFYAEAESETKKQQSLIIIEALLSQGAKPSLAIIETLLISDPQSPVDFQKKLDQPILALLLKHLTTITPFSETVRQRLLSYIAALKSEQVNEVCCPRLKSQRLADVQRFALLLCKPDWRGGELDQHLATEIQQRKKLADHVDSSSLYRALALLAIDGIGYVFIYRSGNG